MSDNQSENSDTWATRSHLSQRTGGLSDSDWPDRSKSHLLKEPTSQELEHQRRRAISNATHYLSAQDLKDFPTTAKFWGLKPETNTYDSGYGDRDRPDMTTAYTWSIVVFDTDEALEAWVLECVERRETYRIIRAEPVKTQVKAVFSVVK